MQPIVPSALIIGASMGGLSAAAALAPCTKHVLIVERDVLSQGNIEKTRKGTPQDRQLHLLLGKGYEILKTLFPGLERALLKKGGEPFNLSADMHLQLHGIWLQKGIHVDSTSSIFLPRRQLEDACRECLLSTYPNVRIEEGRKADLGDTAHHSIIVDATGTSCITKQWLNINPIVQECDINLHYLTCTLSIQNTDVPTPRSIYLRPDHDCMGCFLYKKNKEVYITLMSYEDVIVKAQDVEGIIEWLRVIGGSKKFDILSWADIGDQTELVDGPHPYSVKSQRWTRWDLCPLPPNWIIVGDAYCRLDPAFGQGMTMVAMQAMEIRQWAMTQAATGKAATGKAPNTCMSSFPSLVRFPYWLNASESWRHKNNTGGWRAILGSILHFILHRIVSYPRFPSAHIFFIGLLSGSFYRKNKNGLYQSLISPWALPRLLNTSL